MVQAPRAGERRTRRYLDTLARERRKYVVTAQPLQAALADPRFGVNAGRWLAEMTTKTPDLCQCLCCDSIWQSPTTLVIVEPVGRNSALVAGVCSSCSVPDDFQRRVAKGLNRKIGFGEHIWRTASSAGTA